MSTLAARLDAIRTSFEAQAPADALAVMHGATAALDESGQAEHALGAGAPLPPFTLPDPSGRLVASADFLQRGPLVLTFFRGHW